MRRLDRRASAVIFGVVLGLALGKVVLTASGTGFSHLLQRVRYRLAPPKRTGFYANDPKRGVVHIPNAVIRVETPEYDVLYSTDEVGARRVPGAPGTGPMAIFLGDSFTFGHGVEDDEAYPARVQTHWPGTRVRNRGLNGGSTANALIALRDDLARGDVSLVVYGWIVLHDVRNYLDRSWLEMMARSHQKLPLFRVQDGRPVDMRLVGVSEGRSRDEEGFVEEEFRVTEALIGELARETRAHGARFVFAVLPIHLGTDVQRAALAHLAPVLRANEIEVVDLQDEEGLSADEMFFPVDGHPKPEWHRRVGDALATRITPP